LLTFSSFRHCGFVKCLSKIILDNFYLTKLSIIDNDYSLINFDGFLRKVRKMKKLLLSTSLVLAMSFPAIAATTTPLVATTSTPVTAAPGPTVDLITKKEIKKTSRKMLTREQWLEKITAKRAKVVEAAANLSGKEKELVDSALTRADRWVETIKNYKDESTNFGHSAVRALGELGWIQTITHHKDPYPTENIKKLLTKFETLKAQAATLTGDMKSAADTMVSNFQSVADDLEKHKDSQLMSQLVNGLHKEYWALKRFLHAPSHKAAAVHDVKAVETHAHAATLAAPVPAAPTPAKAAA
jgi:hypothetical protein